MDSRQSPRLTVTVARYSQLVPTRGAEPAPLFLFSPAQGAGRLGGNPRDAANEAAQRLARLWIQGLGNLQAGISYEMREDQHRLLSPREQLPVCPTGQQAAIGPGRRPHV